jgi:hypothetical protein
VSRTAKRREIPRQARNDRGELVLYILIKYYGIPTEVSRASVAS